MSVFMVIIFGFCALLIAGGILMSAVVNTNMPQPVAVAVMIGFAVLYVAAIISRVRFRREHPEQDAKEGRIMAWIGLAIVVLVALANLAKKNKR